MNELIRGKVARILNSQEVALNIGSLQGVIEGMKFDILDPKSEDIKDPDTNEVLGSIERPKVRVKVTLVKDRLSIASTYKKYTVNEGGSGSFALSGFANALMPRRLVQKTETLKTEEKTWEDLDESASYVKIGDPVIQVDEE